MPCNASTLLAANPFTQLDPGLQDAVKLQLLCDISSTAGGGPPVGGSGTAGRLAKFTAGTTLGDSLFSESGDEITLNSGRLIVNRGTIVASSPALDVTSTWNNAAVTFAGIKYNVTDTASASGSLLMDLQVSGVSRISFRKDGQGNFASLFSTGQIRATNFAFGAGSNPILETDGSDILALRRSTNAQTFNVYNTYTSSTNLERLAVRWNSNVAWIDTQKGSGGGTAKDLVLGTDSTERVRMDINGNVVVNTAAIATNATNGFLYVPSCAGTPTGVPTTFTGRVPIVVDTTNNKLYFYSGAAWRDAGP